MTLRTSDRVLWAFTGLVAVALAVVTVLLMGQAGMLQRLQQAVLERPRPATVVQELGDVKLARTAQPAAEALPEMTPTPVPPIPERIFFIAAEQGVPEESVAEHIHLWAIPAAGGEAERIAEGVRAHSFGDIPPWGLIGSGNEQKLVYILGPEEAMRLMALDLRSGEMEELFAADDGQWIASPSVAPDGQRLALITVEPPPGGEFQDDLPGTLHVLHTADGREERQFEPAALWTSLAWSPDSQWLAAVEAGSSTRWPRLLLFPAGGAEPLDPPFSRAWQATWAPAGQRLIAVCGQPEADVELMSWDVAVGEHEPLVLEGQEAGQRVGVIWNLAWSPDGAWLLGLAGDGWSELGLYTVAREGGQPVPLYGVDEGEGAVWWHRWSPDGRRIAFVAAQAASAAAPSDGVGGFVIEPDGDSLWQVDAGIEGRVEWMAWSPDGQRLAFALNSGEGEEISGQLHVVDVDEQRPSLLHEGLGRILYVLWVPAMGGG